MSSELSGFYRLDVQARLARVAELTGLTAADLSVLSPERGLGAEQADRMVENVLGVFGLPLGLCVNLCVNGRDRLVPMATEEPSVVAAASYAAKLMRAGGGIETVVSPAHMIGQIQLLEVPDPEAAARAVLDARAELLTLANGRHPALIGAGGGALDVEVHQLPPLGDDDPVGPMTIVHLIVDVQDAMGANAINSMCERLAPRIEELTGGRAGLRILSNLTDRRTVEARGSVPFSLLRGKGGISGEALARGIVEASVFAERDPYRAATHNKGIMNGVDSVLVALGQDWRAVEAGAHAYAAQGGRYTALARWRIDGDALHGELKLPMAVGTVGGVCGVHPTVQVTRRIADASTAAELASLAAAVGLAQNFSALRALAAEGIQHGHMRLHARNVAVEAGAAGDDIEQVAQLIADRGTVSVSAARVALAELEASRADASRIPEIYQGARRPLLGRFEQLRERFVPRIMGLIDEVVNGATPDGSTLVSMCAYHMETGGKRLRAMLPLLVAEALGHDPARLVPFGAACEMLHNATLVHDDLQDGDLVRRGRMTVWNRYGVPQAINLGDAMFYYAVLLAQRLEPASPSTVSRLLVDTLRVIDGQEREFSLKRARRIGVDDYFAMVEGKTSGLFALPIAGAAEVCGASQAIVDGLEEASRHMGVLFQIQDDTLDLYGDKGRDVRGSDIGEGKRSVLVVHALEAANEEQAAWLVEVLDKDRAHTSPKDVAEVEALFERTGTLTFALQQMKERKARALAVEALQGNEDLLSLIGGMCDLFLKPIQPLLKAHGI